VEARLGLEQATNQSSKKNIGAKGDKRMEIMIIKVSVFIPHSAFRIPVPVPSLTQDKSAFRIKKSHPY